MKPKRKRALKHESKDLLSTIDKHQPDGTSAVLRPLGCVLLLVIANLLAACGSGGGAPVALPTTGSTITSGYSATLAWDPVIAVGIQGYRVY